MALNVIWQATSQSTLVTAAAACCQIFHGKPEAFPFVLGCSSSCQTHIYSLLLRQHSYTAQHWFYCKLRFHCCVTQHLIDTTQHRADRSATPHAGLVLDPELLTSGQIKLTWPIYKTVLRIMVHSDFKTGSLFAFLYAFNWVVWMAIFLTAVGVGLTIAVLEWVSRLHKKPTPQDSERGKFSQHRRNQLRG